MVVARSEEEALAAVDDMLVNKVFGAAGEWEHRVCLSGVPHG